MRYKKYLKNIEVINTLINWNVPVNCVFCGIQMIVKKDRYVCPDGCGEWVPNLDFDADKLFKSELRTKQILMNRHGPRPAPPRKCGGKK